VGRDVHHIESLHKEGKNLIVDKASFIHSNKNVVLR
jgi:hypothetical protein